MRTISGWYPVVLVPTLVSKFGADNPMPVLGENSSSSIEKPPFAPRPPSSERLGYALVLQVWVASAIAVLLINWMVGMSVLALWGSLGCSALFSVGLLCYAYLNNQESATRYQRRLLDYQRRLSEYEERQLGRLKLKGKTHDKYRQELLNRQDRLKSLLLGRVQPPLKQESTAQQGVSERTFYYWLLRYFPQVCQGGEFPIPDTGLRYSADFILYHKKSGLAIDLEIDEPYEGRSGTPHHCSDDPKDARRNQFFLERNWVVVRFSEWQVVKHPVSCCKVIASVVAQITGDYSILIPFQGIADLPPCKQWTTKEAARMAKERYRDTYLLRLPSSGRQRSYPSYRQSGYKSGGSKKRSYASKSANKSIRGKKRF